jgi:S1-C subfamily serine protease
MPVYANLTSSLAGTPRHEVLQTLWYDTKVRYSFDPTTHQVSLIEVFGDNTQDPIELYVDQYAPMATVAAQNDTPPAKDDSQLLFPKRLRLQYGTEPMLLISVDEVILGAEDPPPAPIASPIQEARMGELPDGTGLSLPNRLSNQPRSHRQSDRSKTVLVALQTSSQVASSAVIQPNRSLLGNTSLGSVAVTTEMKTVKLYGAGGAANLDAYQSGFFISPAGHILTAWSTVLDVETVIAITSDGRRLESKVMGIDPNLEIAVLATDQATDHYFDLQQAAIPEVGCRVLAFSNLYGIATGSEMSSVQKGVVMAQTELNARRGSFASVYQGPVLIIDAMTNNPGAAGGALTALDGRLMGMLGKELRDASANTWLNYAIPVTPLSESIQNILSGKSVQRVSQAKRVVDRPASLPSLGLALIPNVLVKTPAYVDLVEPNSRAAKAGVRSDDLILFVNSIRITSQASLLEELQAIDQSDSLTLLVQRGTELQELVLAP